MSILLGITECAALPAGFFGFLGDQIGNSRLALLSFSSLILASSMMLLPALFSTLLLARFGIGFALNVSFVAVQNYVTSQFSLEMRDKVTGALELSYSISALTIVPLLGLVYEAFDWRAPFVLLTGILLVHFPPLIYILCRNQTNSPIEEKIDDISKYNPVSPATGEKREQEFDSQESVGYRSGFVVRNGALAYNLSGFFINLGANLIATEFGILLSEHFELSAGESGLFSLGLALGEFCGVLSTMSPWISSTSYSSLEGSNIFLLAFTLAFLLWGETKLEFTVLLLCLMFACVEFGTVLRFARAARFAHASDASAMLGSHVQFQFAGRTVGALLAASIYQTLGHHFLCAISLASFVLVSILLRLALYQKNKCGALT